MSETATIVNTVITTGLALLGSQLLLFRWLRQDIQSVRQDMRRLEARTDAMEHRLNARIDAIHARIDSLISLFNRLGSAA